VRERARGPFILFYFIFQDDLGHNDIHFSIWPKLMNEQISKMGLQILQKGGALHTWILKSVYLIAKKNKIKKINFFNKVY